MSKENKIFQPKVIIGSITSFVVAAVGIVAVFFPSLLNLEKKSIAEKAIFLRSQDSLKELEEFLLKNVNRPVRLAIGYCHLPSRVQVSNKSGNKRSYSWLEQNYNGATKTGYTYINYFGDNPRTNLEEELDVVAVGNLNAVAGPEGELYDINLENGGIAWSESPGLYKELRIPYDSQNSKKYAWGTGHINDELAEKLNGEFDKCPQEDYATRGVLIVGTFFVHEQDMDSIVANYLYQPYSENQTFYSMELEPLDKKDLEMRNY